MTPKYGAQKRAKNRHFLHFLRNFNKINTKKIKNLIKKILKTYEKKSKKVKNHEKNEKCQKGGVSRKRPFSRGVPRGPKIVKNHDFLKNFQKNYKNYKKF
jgi:hypothetical protein